VYNQRRQKMKKPFLINLGLVLCLCLLTLLSGCCINVGDVFKAKYERTENVSAPIEDAAELCVETDVGSITITGADVTDCDITAEITVKARTKEKARELAEQVKIELQHAGDRLSIKVRKPDALKSRSLTVDFKITAPTQLNLDCSTHVGSMNVSGIKGQIEASANVVGSIEFTAPTQLSAQLNVSSNIGSIKTNKPVTVVGKLSKSIKGTIGSGEGKISLRTNVGSIEIK